VKATEVTAGLAESNGSPLPGLWRDSLHVTCGLTACTPGSAPGPTLSNEYGKTLPFFVTRLPGVVKNRSVAVCRQVEMELFPVLRPRNLRVSAVRLDEQQVRWYVDRAMGVFDANLAGPRDYAALYGRYADLLTAKAERDAHAFLQHERSMDEMKTVRIVYEMRSKADMSQLNLLHGNDQPTEPALCQLYCFTARQTWNWVIGSPGQWVIGSRALHGRNENRTHTLLHRDAEKRNRFSFVYVFLLLGRNWRIFFTRIKESISYNSVFLILARVNNFA